MKPIDQMARAAGFRKAGEVATCNQVSDEDKLFGMDIVTSPLMPEGFVALRTERGAMVLGPNGSYWVPFQ